jgi:hypothetical protein
MTENEALETIIANPKPKILILGGLIGALMGVGAAYLFIQRAERENRSPVISPSEGIKLGLVALGAMKQFAQLGGGEK